MAASLETSEGVEIEIFWDDLAPHTQELISSIVGNDHNWDVIPITTLFFEPDDVSDCGDST